MSRFVAVVTLTIGLTTAMIAQSAPPNPNRQTPIPSKDTGIHDPFSAMLEVLTNTQGVDFGPYLSRVVAAIREKWYSLIPNEAKPPQSKAGEVVIGFVITADGQITDLKLTDSSGDSKLDRAGRDSITGAAPFPALPVGFKGNMQLRMHFYYNPSKVGTKSNSASPAASAATSSSPPK